ncbi:MAG TPA: adenylate/guanylate cyclase domain-containing protein [Aestuariivirgaceae bacterium]
MCSLALVANQAMERKLAAILAADVVGYSRLMEQDEAGTFERLRVHRKELFEPEIEKHHGHIFKLMGDGLLVEFASVVDAMECAVVLQREMAERNKDVADGRRIDVRIGINLGDVIIEGEDRHGEGVNIAARLQQLAKPGSICVSGKVYEEVVGKLDLGFDFLGEQPVKNIAKPVRIYCARLDGAHPTRSTVAKHRPNLTAIVVVLLMLAAISGATAWYWIRTSADPILALPSGPSIAVLPFTNLSSDPSDVYFSVGLTEDIITALSRFSDLLVFARESTGQFTGSMIDPREVRRKLGAHYVLVGSVRRSQDQLRVTAKLLDAKDGGQLWSQSYDRDLTASNVFAVQDEITERIVGLVGSPDASLTKPKIQEALREKRPNNLAAYECVLFSIWIYDSFKPEAHAQARDCLERAIAGPTANYALAWAHLGQMYFEEYKYRWNLRPEPIERALAATKKALELDPQEQWAHYVEALILYVSEKDLDVFYDAAERAIALNPNNAFILSDLGLWMIYSGRWERGKALVEKAVVLNPLHQDWVNFAFFLDHYRKGEYREALGVQRKMNVPNNQGIQAGLAAVYGQLGDTKKAKATLDHILQLWPEFANDPRAWFVRRRFSGELLEFLMDGLRKAGLQVPPQEQQEMR